MSSLVLTVMGPDRPGLVKLLSDKVTEFDGNWLESRMTNLEDQFTGIVHLQVPAANADALIAALRELEAFGLQILIAKGRRQTASVSPSRTIELDLIGHDHPGIVRDISKVLTKMGVSIDSLETERMCGAWSGECLFKAKARLRVPADVQTEEVCVKLEMLANDLVVDITVDEVDSQ